ncbi:MAG: hypothetical protein JWM00_459 [Candidatus Saccharibacteria bacterium]|nr:hypothetical protein [Candidatus Saccharibacteria bacterium]
MSAEFFHGHDQDDEDSDVHQRLTAARQLIDTLDSLWYTYRHDETIDQRALGNQIKQLTYKLSQDYASLNTELRPKIDELSFGITLPLLIIQEAVLVAEERINVL